MEANAVPFVVFAAEDVIAAGSGDEEGCFDVIFFKRVEESGSVDTWAVVESEINDFTTGGWGGRLLDDAFFDSNSTFDLASISGFVGGRVSNGIGTRFFRADFAFSLDGNFVAVVNGGGARVFKLFAVVEFNFCIAV